MPQGPSNLSYGVPKSPLPFREPRRRSLFKKILWFLLGGIAALFLLIYLALGDLRFFANHYFGLAFFSKHYLLVLQNNYELRPTGGFVTAYGTLDTFLGFPTRLEFKNSYDIETQTYVPAPKPQEDMLKNEWYQGYTFRDANWEPDLRKTAPELLKFYHEKYPEASIDGVVTVNFSLIETLADRLGGLRLNGKVFDRDTLFGALEFEVNNIDRHNVEALQNRKSVLGDLAAQLFSKAKRHPFAFRNVIADALKQKDISLWLKDESLENRLIEKGWANVLVPAERSDFLAVNLANLGAKKADRYVQKEIRYYANVTHDVPQITTEVTLRFPGLPNTHSADYRGYLRLYAPQDSTLEKAPPKTENTTEGDLRVLGTPVDFPVGGQATFSYTYTLPRTAFLPDQFNLRLIRQSGSEALYTVVVENSEGKRARSAQFRSLENRADFTQRLTQDQDLSLEWEPEHSPPYVLEQEFEDLTHVRIVWNKPLDPSAASDAAHYQLTDLNAAFPATDTVTVTKVDLRAPNVTILEVRGLTDQPQEHYQLVLKDIADLADDVIMPNPKTITLVQRIKK